METPFNELSKEDQRMLVLKDAVELIKSGFLIPQSTVVLVQSNNWSYFSDMDKDTQLKPILEKMVTAGKQCSVCERGALLVATVLRDNDFTVGQIESGGVFKISSRTDQRLMRIFDADQLQLMEAELMACDTGDKRKAIEIFENAISNGGIYNP